MDKYEYDGHTGPAMAWCDAHGVRAMAALPSIRGHLYLPDYAGHTVRVRPGDRLVSSARGHVMVVHAGHSAGGVS